MQKMERPKIIFQEASPNNKKHSPLKLNLTEVTKLDRIRMFQFSGSAENSPASITSHRSSGSYYDLPLLEEATEQEKRIICYLHKEGVFMSHPSEKIRQRLIVYNKYNDPRTFRTPSPEPTSNPFSLSPNLNNPNTGEMRSNSLNLHFNFANLSTHSNSLIEKRKKSKQMSKFKLKE